MASAIVYFILLCTSFLKIYSQDILEGKVIEGVYANILHHPHAVFLDITDHDKSTHICGSSVVNQLYLVSAAHCVFRVGTNGTILAFAGHENLKKTRVLRRGLKAIVHSEYDDRAVVNDIALLLLDKKLPLGSHIKRIIIRKNFSRGTSGILAGWGIINDITLEDTMFLKYVTQTLKDRRDCKGLGMGPGNICAGSTRNSDPRPASGDSGSGLVTEDYQLIGILSYKVPKFSALPIYTNVSHYYYWIKHQTSLNFCN